MKYFAVTVIFLFGLSLSAAAVAQNKLVEGVDTNDATVGLDKLIEALINDVSRVSQKSKADERAGGASVFTLGDAELELRFVLEEGQGGKVEAKFWGFGGSGEVSSSNSSIQTVRLKLEASRSSQDKSGQWVGPRLSSSLDFNPQKNAIAIPSANYEALLKQSGELELGKMVPGPATSFIPGVPANSVVVNGDEYEKWVDTISKKKPELQKDKFLGQKFDLDVSAFTSDYNAVLKKLGAEGNVFFDAEGRL